MANALTLMLALLLLLTIFAAGIAAGYGIRELRFAQAQASCLMNRRRHDSHHNALHD